MSDFVDLIGRTAVNNVIVDPPLTYTSKHAVPEIEDLKDQLAEASRLVSDVVLKNYLGNLTELEIIPLDDSLKGIGHIQLFKINEMVYQNDEYSTYKLSSVFNSVQSLNCGVFIIVDSSGSKIDFYMGVRSLDDKRTTSSLKNTLRNALQGQFPGVVTESLRDPSAEKLLSDICANNIAAVSCVAKNKDEDFKENGTFIQGLEKLIIAMQGQRYTAIVLAKSTSIEQLDDIRRAYETIYTQLSPFANMQLSYGTNTALSISDAFSKGTTVGTSHSTNSSTQTGTSSSRGTSTNESESKADTSAMLIKAGGSALLGIASIVAAPLTGVASLVAAGTIMAGQVGVNTISPSTKAKGTSINESYSKNQSKTVGVSDSTNEGTSETNTQTKGLTSGTSDNIQLTMQNKTLLNTLERIDLQLKRIEDCESLGMWECAAYFLSDSQETAEMAAGTYKALMKGDKSGVETSAINHWGRKNKKEIPLLREYIMNFIHPVFEYKTAISAVPVMASSLVSGHELAIQMGLPRKSVCGFPVIEHAEFGKEIIRYGTGNDKKNDFMLGSIFNMGKKTDTEVRLDRDSLAMHTFVTGSTGSGKSNTVYEMLNQLRTVFRIPFLIVEPAKGEYKNIFGQFPDVTVYGTNPKKYCKLLRINPFRFPADIHVLEHLDRLVELFNVCWPMYAAMPAILKEAMEKAYVATGWNISTSENPKGEMFPNFTDLLEQIENVINESKYSADSKGDYSGALCTRVRSLTTGLNGLIFRNDDLTDVELFDMSVIIDLSRIGSTETKSLIMGLLVMKLNEYRMTSGKINSQLSHITVLEEAHNLLKRTSTVQSAEGSNLLGKSVELLANSIAEMRTYGEGFIIADQSPGLLDMSVIRNTNTKIILRLPEQGDRELVGRAASLNDEQICELSKLGRGVAAIYQNDWIEPVLVQVNKCAVGEKLYQATKSEDAVDVVGLRKQLINFLIQSRTVESLEYNIDEIECGINMLNLSSRNREFIEDLIAEYKKDKKVLIWDDSGFKRLSRFITDLLDARTQVEKCVTTAADNAELTSLIRDIVLRINQTASDGFILAVSQCLLKDMSISESNSEIRENIYKQWVDFLNEGVVL